MKLHKYFIYFSIAFYGMKFQRSWRRPYNHIVILIWNLIKWIGSYFWLNPRLTTRIHFIMIFSVLIIAWKLIYRKSVRVRFWSSHSSFLYIAWLSWRKEAWGFYIHSNILFWVGLKLLFKTRDIELLRALRMGWLYLISPILVLRFLIYLNIRYLLAFNEIKVILTKSI